jgi:hypothetical protein
LDLHQMIQLSANYFGETDHFTVIGVSFVTKA